MKQAITAAVVFALLALSGCGDMALRDMIVDLVTKAAVTVPEAPSGLSANSLSVSRIHLAWTDNSSNETGFKIERSPDGSSGWTQVQLTAANATNWDDAGLMDGTNYYYRMRASNASGDSPYSNIASGTTDSYLPSFAGGIAIKAAGDSIAMGDGTYGPNVSESFSYSFTMSKYEITNSQFAQFISDGGYTTQSYWTTNGWTYKQSAGWTQPAYWTDANFIGANQPVVGVTWYEAVAFCNWRSAKDSLTPAYDSAGHATLSASGYRLPTEVEWEYAAAKGESGQAERIYAWGDTWDSSKAVCNATRTADVGSKSMAGGDTPQGLADMSGNVLEWCSDNWQTDGSIAIGTDRHYFVDDSTSHFFILRGGAWGYAGEEIFRCAYRYVDNPSNRVYSIGFRVVRP